MTTLDNRPVALATDRCHCGHTRAAHDGRAVLYRDDPGLGARLAVEAEAGPPYHRLDPTGRLWRSWPDACALMLCRCEVYRGEADR